MKDANGRNSNPHTHGRKRLLIGGGTILCLLLPLSAQSDEPFRSPAPSAPAQRPWVTMLFRGQCSSPRPIVSRRADSLIQGRRHQERSQLLSDIFPT
jgi:hypothetical protein